jgi:uncharacterized membrane protein YhaH (DUF805 family)
MSVGYRQLLERLFRRYARFGGRAGRAEFWLFVLVFILVTECSWLVGYGAASLVTGKNGYTHIDASSLTSGTTITYSSTSAGGANDSLPFTDADEAGDIVLKLHRHNDDEGWHFHGRLHLKNGDARPTSRHDYDGKRREWMKDRRDHAQEAADIIELVVSLALLVPLLAVGCRRLHDTNKSGWWQLFWLIPVAGWLVLIIFFAMPSDTDENRFGPPDAV